MKICIVRDYTAPAKDEMGAERVVEGITKGLINLGHDVIMKLNPNSTNTPAPLVSEIPKDCDIIHFNQWDPKDSHDSYGIPWVATIHGGGMETDPAWLKRTIDNPHIIAVSQFVASRLNLKAHVWTCSDSENFVYKKTKDDYFLWMAGTDWGEGKGLFTTIRLAKKLGIKLKLAGTGKNQGIIDTIKSLTDNKIKFVGAVNGQKKAELIANAKGFILLTQLPDACPTVVGECMLSGTPIIGSIHGSMPELINDKVGFICKTEADITKAIIKIGTINPEDCRDYGMENFDYMVSARKHLQCYENMLNLGRVA